ncbi:MAG TPA: hypothetical protein VJQ47_16705 [Steroidobacteraceae bacterium]|nr:hypothetical protein [Steroidobacteraceae bacterium]
MKLRIGKRPAPGRDEVLETYSFPSRTVQIVQGEGERIRWQCDCEKFRRWSSHREPLWCKHIAKAAARRSIERLTRRVASAKDAEH